MTTTIGIFSRSWKHEFSWLSTQLQASGHVHTFYISNYNGKEFREAVKKCSVAILYHSKNKGRVNITDVTDSLYDNELEYLSQMLGKRNVFVIIDDLEESGQYTKNRILQNQPTIEKLAQDVFFFTTEEKLNTALMSQKMSDIKSSITPRSSPYIPTISRKLLITPHKAWQLPHQLIWHLILAAGWLFYFPYIFSIVSKVGLMIIIVLAGSLSIFYTVYLSNKIPVWQKIILVFGVIVVETVIVPQIISLPFPDSVICPTLFTGTGVWILSVGSART